MPDAIILAPALSWSGALQRQVQHNAAFRAWLIEAAQTPVHAARIQQWYQELLQEKGGDMAEIGADVHTIRRALRLLRQRVFYTLMLRDISQVAPLSEVTDAMTHLAVLTIQESYRSVAQELAGIHGIPIDATTGLPQEMLIVAMGKLGGSELNVSSDIDLIMLYGEDGETGGRRRTSHHEFYGKLTRRMMPVISERDEHGMVFRTDLRLRPDGDAGPLAWSLEALEHYLVAQGREWERYAWIKARPIACQAFPGSDSDAQIEQIQALRTPFVYRKYFDFDALAALRGLRERIRQDWQRRALSRTGVDTWHHIKLGEGGIREVEFVVQLNQLIRGGRMPSLQEPNLLTALSRQRDAEVIDGELADKLAQAYCFLRRVEHMLQYREDEQTHLLPRAKAGMDALAQAMGMSPADFKQTLGAHREFVASAFRDAFGIAGMSTGGQAPDPGSDDETDWRPLLGETMGEDASHVGQRIDALLAGHRIRSLPRASRQRLDALLPAVLKTAAQTETPATTALRLLELVEHIAQRSAYMALLAEYPETLARVARIVSASPWASQFLRRYPILLDSLIEWQSLLEPLDFQSIAQQMRRDLDACQLPDGSPDVEQQMNLMRDTQHQSTFQLLAQDLEGVLTVEQLADQLSALADMMLAETIKRVWPLVQNRDRQHAPPAPRFAIVAYGKLGGKELGYASDLDLVFLYEDPTEEAALIYTKLSRRVASWLSTLTSSGRLYEIDLRLRPDGDAGLLAVPMDAFAQYQVQHAWPWEHQAITRARYVAGDPAIGARFEEVRRDVLLLERDPEELRKAVREMRQKITAGHPNRSEDFDIKHDPGGMVDVEFITQYLVLCYARHHPELLGNLGNIALMRLCAAAGLIPETLATQVADAYRQFRKRQHAVRLQGAEKARVPSDQLLDERQAVRELWKRVIGD